MLSLACAVLLAATQTVSVPALFLFLFKINSSCCSLSFSPSSLLASSLSLTFLHTLCCQLLFAFLQLLRGSRFFCFVALLCERVGEWKSGKVVWGNFHLKSTHSTFLFGCENNWISDTPAVLSSENVPKCRDFISFHGKVSMFVNAWM